MRKGTTIAIRDDVIVTIADIDQRQVKLGIKVPKDMKIEREIN